MSEGFYTETQISVHKETVTDSSQVHDLEKSENH